MAFQAPITVKTALEHIHRRDYLLPAIQREFIWWPEDIVLLFDSLMRGYPIGSFLFWKVLPETKKEFQFYEFLREYHERDSFHNPKANLVGDAGITAVLDGQQRLTSLYIGLHGSHAERKKYARVGSDSAYPRKRLYLNLSCPSNAVDLAYDFQFRKDTSDWTCDGDDFWFRVGGVLQFKGLEDITEWIFDRELTTDRHAVRSLNRLYNAVSQKALVNFYEETDQDLDKVLNIFIRVNSGGGRLSYSDLLLSIATAQWENRDAREEIHALVDEINRNYGEFNFDKDFVLKCCLVLTDLDIRWKVDNFNHENMQRIEGAWDAIAASIRNTVRLLASFGFTGTTLISTNAVIPIVYYLSRKSAAASYGDADAQRKERDAIRTWLNLVLLKRIFGGVPDNVLRPLRDVIRTEHESFPAASMGAALRGTARPMSFSNDELEGLLDFKYGKAYTFSVLALLYPDLDFRNHFHQDHLHPRSRFTPAQLKRAGIPVEERDFFQDAVDRLANLQLLEGVPNREKSNRPFAEWIADRYPEPSERQVYLRRHFIPDVDFSLENFEEFYGARRKLMLTALRRLVGASERYVKESGQVA